MSRQFRSALDEASSSLDEAWEAYFVEDTPFTRAEMEAATRRFIDVLHPFVGHELAFRFQVALEEWIDANQRLLSFNAAVSSGVASVVADDALRRDLLDRQSIALRGFEEIQKAVKESLDALPNEGAS